MRRTFFGILSGSSNQTIPVLSSPPQNPSLGTIYFDSSLGKLGVYTSLGWKYFDDASGTNPTISDITNARVDGVLLSQALYHRTNRVILGNYDWTSFIYHDREKCTYDRQLGGLKISGEAWVKIRLRMPVSPTRLYRVRAKVKKLSGNGTFFLGAISLDENFYELSTDQTPSYHYFVADSLSLFLGFSYYLDNTIGEYNLPTESSFHKFDPGTKYFDLIIVANYGATQNPSETLIEYIEVEEIYNYKAETQHGLVVGRINYEIEERFGIFISVPQQNSGDFWPFGIVKENGDKVFSIDDNGNVGWSGTLYEGTVPWQRLSNYPTLVAGNGLAGGGSLSQDTITLRIAENSITTEMLADNSVTLSKLSSEVLNSISLEKADLYWSGINWDNITTPGWYRVVPGGSGGSGTAPPTGGVNEGLLIVQKGQNGAITQVFFPKGNNFFVPLFRQFNGTAWSGWNGRINSLPSDTPTSGDFVLVDSATNTRSPYKVSIGPSVNNIPVFLPTSGLTLAGQGAFANLGGSFLFNGANGYFVKILDFVFPETLTNRSAYGTIYFLSDRGDLSETSVVHYGFSLSSSGRVARATIASPFYFNGFNGVRLLGDVIITQTESPNKVELWVVFSYTPTTVKNIIFYHLGASLGNVAVSLSQRTTLPSVITGGFHYSFGVTGVTNSNFSFEGRLIRADYTLNGVAYRFDNGFQICFHRIPSSTNQVITWTYPAAFASSVPIVIATPEKESTDTPNIVNFDVTPTSTYATIKKWNITLSSLTGASAPVHLIAFGLWRI